MIRKIIFATLIFLSFQSFGQNCKYVKNEVDEFTKDEILMTSISVLSYGNGQHEVVRTQAVKINGRKAIKCYFVTKSFFAVNENSKFILLDDEKNTYEMNFPEFISSDYDRSWNTYYLTAMFFPDDELFDDLQNKIFKKLRFYTTKGYVEHDIKNNHLRDFRNSLTCIK